MITVIYHNPDCGTSRNTLAMIRASGEEPHVIEYLKTPPSRQKLEAMLQAMAMPPRELLRRKGTPYDDLNLDDPALTDGELIDAMMAHPILINRPIVETDLGIRLCRPSETVFTLLPHPPARFVKEDGDVVVSGDNDL
ncbi:arsenate reductase (glutaredoxin) [Marinobacter bohaiensis]|uniref:arsenate reductase (glutaredoxin) n=1 Tax=Marinobacter bohaiensis TaxID=2201898 RepID=UPI000DAD53BA|nr:arsenate reductase (glutaredoxin) [Marinobacter bohaiensis]